jgi:surface antigen
MKFKAVAAAALIALFATGCENSGYGTKQTIGAATGGALGGLLGAQFGSGSGQLAATGAGVLIGALIGSEVGKSLDETDRMRADQAVNTAHSAPIGETIVWNNPESGNYGNVTPVRDGTSNSGLYCREFQQVITVGGRTETAYGTACQEPDGTWRIVE